MSEERLPIELNSAESGALAGTFEPLVKPVISLGQDSIVRGLAAALVLASLPFLTPIFSEEWRAVYARHIVNPVFMLGVLFAIRLRLRKVVDLNERRFWNFLTLGFACWLMAMLIGTADDIEWVNMGGANAFLRQGSYLGLYAAICVALEVHPHVRHDPITYPLRFLDWAGSFVLLFGMLLYFLVVPSIAATGTVAIWTSSMALFVSFDGYIILRLWRHWGAAETQEWRSVYGWLLVGVTLWGIGDIGSVLIHEGFIADPGWGAPFDFIWCVAFAAVVVATRAATGQGGVEHANTQLRRTMGMGPLVVYVLAPLLLHVAFYRFGTPDPDFRFLREELVLGLTTILACLTLVYHRLLRIENRRLADKEVLARENLVHQAFHDELTGLPNRNLFSDRLRLAMAHCQRYESKCCVMFCDLDQFKLINDSLGHEAGDEVLVAVAQRLRASVRGQDTVARFGGDEFAIMVQDMHRVMDIALVAEKLLSALARPLVVNGKSHVLTASIGISIFPDDAEEIEALLNHADTAMYQAKLHGRNTYRHFTEAMNQAAQERLAIEQGLRAGLMADRFVVFYQPIVELPSGKAIGFEALLRWNHPERAYITPVNFMDVAEQTGLIVPIGKWVLETACRWAMELDTSGGVLPSVSVNLSARQFRDPGLIQDVARVLARTGLEPARLQLEISETMALTIDSTAIALKGLQELGVRVAIDDFGTGYASLSHLQELPVDVVKIDKSFVRGIEIDSVREAIVQAIVNMARALNFYVVAEGVETARELEIIQQSQCDAAQGYYLCEPLPPQELKEIMARPNPWLGFKSEPEDPDQ